MWNANDTPSPMITNCKLSKNGNIHLLDPLLYRSIVSALQYVSLTRPDIAFSVNKKLSLHVYSEFDWDSDSDDRRSTYGSCIFFGPNLVSWSSKKLPPVAQSSTEVEYNALAYTTLKLISLESLLNEL
ncbi:uncharacterized mitochondrial protein AtMg00810-like [Vicia villosa]|uniref:uncharacterized mitochondrial protein AtMg00810-like n=1 Tax=Vicia villosa TaxID=3911 RepID=UPI00273B2307|nr:uncharacterized mitochondrial protein AtMg00810-like [Vicia villosa]